MKIAITSSDGFSIDQEFENSTSFYVFNLTGEKLNFLEFRNFSRTNGDSTKDISQVFHVIKDCKAIYTAKINPKYSKEFKEKGFVIYEKEGEIHEILAPAEKYQYQM